MSLVTFFRYLRTRRCRSVREDNDERCFLAINPDIENADSLVTDVAGTIQYRLTRTRRRGKEPRCVRQNSLNLRVVLIALMNSITSVSPLIAVKEGVPVFIPAKRFIISLAASLFETLGDCSGKTSDAVVVVVEIDEDGCIVCSFVLTTPIALARSSALMSLCVSGSRNAAI